MYRMKGKSKKYGLELAIIAELQKRLAAEDGWTRIKMKEDEIELDISHTVDNKYLITFPPYYGDRDYNSRMKYKPLDEWFRNLDEVAEFIVNKGWQRKW